MGERRLDRNRQRANFGGGPEAQIDAEDIALASDMAERFHQRARDPLRRLARIVAGSPGKQMRIIEQDRVDIGAVVQFARAVLAQRQGDEPGRLGIGHPAADRIGDGGIHSPVGKGGEFGSDPGERKRARQIADRQRQRQRHPLAPQGDRDIIRARARGFGPGQRLLPLARRQQVGEIGHAVHRPRKKRRVGLGALQSAGPWGG